MIKVTVEQQKEIVSVADAQIAAFIRGLPDTVDKILNSAILSILGLERDTWGGKLKIDNGNGRRSIFVELIDADCRELIEKMIQPVIKTAIDDLLKDTQFLDAIVSDAKERIRSALRYTMGKAAESYAQAQCRAMIEGLEAVDLNKLFLPNTAAEDPESFDTELGNLLLEKLAPQLTAGKKIVRSKKSVVLE